MSEHELVEEDLMSQKEKSMSNNREKMVAQVKAESGLDDETFGQVLDSFQYENGGADIGNFSFRLKGHELKGYASTFHAKRSLEHEGISGMIYAISIDGKKVSNDQLVELEKKFGPVIEGLSKLSNKHIEQTATQDQIDDLLN